MTTIYELARRNRPHIGKGVRVKRFRRPNHWKVQNRVLMAILLSERIELSRLAELTGVAPRTVASWVYEGRLPSENNMNKVSEVLKLPAHILFAEHQNAPEIDRPEGTRFLWRMYNTPVKNRILAGLMAVHDISPADAARKMGMSPGSLRKYIHQGAIPREQYQEKIEQYFHLNRSIIFAECYLNK